MSPELYELIKDQRSRNGLLHMTYIYVLDLKDTYYYSHLARLEELQKTYPIYNGHLEHETPLYVIIQNNKFVFMEKSIELNPFDSTHFVWIDFGINHVAKDTEHIHEWIHKVPDKIKQLCINPYLENIDPKIYFHNIYHNCAGGLMSGSKENLMTYTRLFREKTEQIYGEDWYQIDESVMTVIQRENPDLFEYYYGDYEGIISNYLRPIHSISLIHVMLRKFMQYNKRQSVWHILNFLEPYYIQECHHTTGGFYEYITAHIIFDYYANKERLHPVVVYLIHKRLKLGDTRMRNLIESNKNNLDFYKNKEEIHL